MTGTTALSATFGSASSTAAVTTDREKLAAAAKQFEAIFLREMLSAARKTDFGGESDMIGDGGLDTFRQMQDDHFADIAAKTGTIGMAKIIEAQLGRFLPPHSAPQTPAAQNGGAQ